LIPSLSPSPPHLIYVSLTELVETLTPRILTGILNVRSILNLMLVRFPPILPPLEIQSATFFGSQLRFMTSLTGSWLQTRP